MYTAAVLTKGSADLLKAVVCRFANTNDFVFETSRGDRLPHHMTINMGGFDSTLNPKDEVYGQKCRLTIQRIYKNDELGVCAAQVVTAICGERSVRTINDQKSCKHITICLKPHSKPVLSNKMFESPLSGTEVIELESDLELESEIQEVTKSNRRSGCSLVTKAVVYTQ